MEDEWPGYGENHKIGNIHFKYIPKNNTHTSTQMSPFQILAKDSHTFLLFFSIQQFFVPAQEYH